jgi:hypothetical protein
MSLVCKYCEKQFTSTHNLKRHQTYTKSCLKIQKERFNIDDHKSSLFKCKYCKKEYSSKQYLDSHLAKCAIKDREKLEDKNKEIREKDKENKLLHKENEELKNEILVLKTEVRMLREQNERSTSAVEEIAKQPRVQQNNNQKILITSNMDLSQERMKDMIENSFNANYMIQGQKGVARFAYDTILKDDQGKLKYICTDPSRQIFQYKNEEGELQKDVKAKKLTKALLDGELKSASHKIASDKMKENTEDFLEYSTYYLDIKELEDDNSDFSKELSTLVI